jgi:hypothetical protein
MPTTKLEEITNHTGNSATNNGFQQGHKKKKGNVAYMHMGRNKYILASKSSASVSPRKTHSSTKHLQIPKSVDIQG